MLSCCRIDAALPFKFTEPLTDTTVTIGDTVTLTCKVSKKGAKIQWYKDGKKLERSKSVEILSEGLVQMLRLHSVAKPADVATYSCKLKKGDQADETSCVLAIEGKHGFILYYFRRSCTYIPNSFTLAPRYYTPSSSHLTLAGYVMLMCP